MLHGGSQLLEQAILLRQQSPEWCLSQVARHHTVSFKRGEIDFSVLWQRKRRIEIAEEKLLLPFPILTLDSISDFPEEGHQPIGIAGPDREAVQPRQLAFYSCREHAI